MYVVTDNIPGYMPESEAGEFDTLKEAQGYLRSEAERYNGEGWQTVPDVVPYDALMFKAYIDKHDPHDLGRIVEIIEVDD